jgi:hypothetical protein
VVVPTVRLTVRVSIGGLDVLDDAIVNAREVWLSSTS